MTTPITRTPPCEESPGRQVLRELTLAEVREYRKGIAADLLVEMVTGIPLPPATPWSQIRAMVAEIEKLTFGTAALEKN
jgi:hypothetical protein